MPRLSVLMVRVSLLHFGIAFTLGGLLLFHKGVPLDARLWRVWPLHIEMALVGWTVQLAMGVAYWILPRFSGEQKYGRRVIFVWAAWLLLNVGVIGVGAAAWIGGADELTFAGRIAELAAVLLFAIYIWPRVKPLETGGQK